MKKQYILLAVLVINFTTINPMDSTKRTEEAPLVFYYDIDWNPDITTYTIPAPTVPKIKQSWTSYGKSIGKSILPNFIASSPETVQTTIEKLKPQDITDENRAEYRRNMDRATSELITEIDAIMTKHNTDIPLLLENIFPKMKTLVSITNTADSLKIIDSNLQLLVLAWIKKYNDYISQLDTQYDTSIKQYRIQIKELSADIGHTNNFKNGLYSLKNLDQNVVDKKRTRIESQVNSMLAVSTQCLDADNNTTQAIKIIKDIILESKNKKINPGFHQMCTTRKSLKNQREKILAELAAIAQEKLKALQENQEVDEIIHSNIKITYISEKEESSPGKKYTNIGDLLKDLPNNTIKQ